jgi:hypothetical protein
MKTGKQSAIAEALGKSPESHDKSAEQKSALQIPLYFEWREVI